MTAKASKVSKPFKATRCKALSSLSSLSSKIRLMRRFLCYSRAQVKTRSRKGRSRGAKQPKGAKLPRLCFYRHYDQELVEYCHAHILETFIGVFERLTLMALRRENDGKKFSAKKHVKAIHVECGDAVHYITRHSRQVDFDKFDENMKLHPFKGYFVVSAQVARDIFSNSNSNKEDKEEKEEKEEKQEARISVVDEDYKHYFGPAFRNLAVRKGADGLYRAYFVGKSHPAET